MYISDPGNDGQARTMIPNGCTAVGAKGCSADVRVVAPTNVVIAWTNALPPWSLCRSRAHLTVLTTPRHFTANTITVLRSDIFLTFAQSTIQAVESRHRVNSFLYSQSLSRCGFLVSNKNSLHVDLFI